jgi:ABC-type transport system involved in multi-copper enzyme maturation permease subunit
MSTTIAAQMAGADFLKLRKKRGTLIWALVLAWAPIVIFYAVTAIQHASNSVKYGPAGGTASFHDGVRLLGGLLFGPLVAILIGVEAGTNDASAGVFRDLVVTGRSRVALFASRVPAALALCWAIVVSAYALVLLGTFVFAGDLPTPDGALILNGLGSPRKFVLSQALVHFSPVGLGDDGRHAATMAGGTALLVIVLWLVVFLGLGAWRTRTMDA